MKTRLDFTIADNGSMMGTVKGDAFAIAHPYAVRVRLETMQHRLTTVYHMVHQADSLTESATASKS